MKKFIVLFLLVFMLYGFQAAYALETDTVVAYPKQSVYQDAWSLSQLAKYSDGKVFLNGTASFSVNAALSYVIDPATDGATIVGAGGGYTNGSGAVLRANGNIFHFIRYSQEGGDHKWYEVDPSLNSDTLTSDYVNSSKEIYAATPRANGEIIYAGESGYAYRISSSNVKYNVASGNTWNGGTGNSINTLLTLSSGNIVAAGTSGRFQIITTSNTWGTYGITPSGANVLTSLQRPDGSMILAGGTSYAIYNSSMSLITSGTASISIRSAINLNNGYVLFVGGGGAFQILKPDNTLTGTGTITFAGGLSSTIDGAALNSDGSVYMFSSSLQGGYRRCYFQAQTPTVVSQTQTTVNLSWDVSTPGPWTYDVEYRPEGSGTWTNGYSGTSNTCQVTGLTAGTRYYFRVRAKIDSTYTFGYSGEATVRTIPPTPSLPTGVTSGVTWDDEHGRSKVVLSWTASTGATGYKVYVFDGSAYRAFTLGNVLTWDSSTAKIYPDETYLDVQPDNSISTDCFNHSAGGFDLRDDPNGLYLKTTGTTHDSYHKYWFRVSAINESGESGQSTAYQPTLPNRTDTTSPGGTAAAESTDGLSKTYSTDINVTVDSTDTGSGIYRIQLSNDNVSFTTVYTGTKLGDNSTGVLSYSDTYSWTVTAGAGTKTIYVKTIDSTGNSNTATCNIVFAEDSTPPTITMEINSGDEYTTDAVVMLSFTGYDNTNTTSDLQMCFSNDGNTWSAWEAYSSTKAWNITSGYGGTAVPGTKTVYARFLDVAQNYAMVTGEISYSSSQPFETVSVTGGTAGTLNGKSVIFVSGDLPTISVTAGTALYIRYDTGNGNWSDWEDYTSTVDLVLAKSNGTCKVRVQIKDSYGVPSEETVLLVVADSEAPVIDSVQGEGGATCSTSGSFNVTVSATDNMPGQLQAQAKVNGGSYGGWVNIPDSSVPVSLSNGANTITVQVKDAAGNTTTKTITAFGL